VAVVGSEHPVVERLLVVRVRAGPQQPLGERLPVRMRRLAPNPLLAAAEAAGEGGERRREPEPEEARVRVRAGVEQGVRGGQDGVLGSPVGDHSGRGKDSRVGQVEQWGPVLRTARVSGRRRVRGEVRPYLADTGGGRGGRDRRAVQFVQQETGCGPARRGVPFVVAQTGQRAEAVRGGRPVVGWGVAAQVGDCPDDTHQVRPSREAVAAGHAHLGVCESEGSRVGERSLRVRVVAPDQVHRGVRPTPDPALQVSGLTTQAVRRRTVGQSGHGGLLPMPGSARRAERRTARGCCVTGGEAEPLRADVRLSHEPRPTIATPPVAGQTSPEASSPASAACSYAGSDP
jgi:hypothetical protein